jgi:hypothetical protein
MGIDYLNRRIGLQSVIAAPNKKKDRKGSRARAIDIKKLQEHLKRDT